MTKRVLILATDGFEQSELFEPKKALEAAGFETVLASPKTGSIRGWSNHNWGESIAVDAALNEVEVIGLIENFADAGKTIAAICHAPWLLIEADIVDGRAVTGWPSIHTDLENAGAQVFDEEVIVDGNLITSRKPDDIPAFARALIEALQDQPETV